MSITNTNDEGRPTDVRSILDVLDSELGDLTAKRINALTEAEINSLAEAVNAFYSSWQAPPLAPDDLRFYSGGWVAGNLEAEESRQHLYTSLLYASGVVMHDPIAEWFDPKRERLRSPPPLEAALGGMRIQGAEPQLLRGDGYFAFRKEPGRTRARLALAIPMLTELAPLIRRGMVVPIPQWQLVRSQQDAILTAVRHDVKDAALADLIKNASSESPPRSDHIRGMDITPSGGVAERDELRAVVQNPAYFLNKTFAIAKATSSRYLPPAAIDAALRDYRVGKLGEDLRREKIHLQVVAALEAVDLPFLGSLDAKTIMGVHSSEQAFGDWRRELRTVVRVVESTPSEGEVFSREAQEVISDALLPRAREVKRAVSRSRVMKSAAADQVVAFGLGAVSIAGAAITSGTAVAPATFLALGLSSIARAVYSSVFGSSPVGTHGVLAVLVKKR